MGVVHHATITLHPGARACRNMLSGTKSVRGSFASKHLNGGAPSRIWNAGIILMRGRHSGAAQGSFLFRGVRAGRSPPAWRTGVTHQRFNVRVANDERGAALMSLKVTFGMPMIPKFAYAPKCGQPNRLGAHPTW